VEGRQAEALGHGRTAGHQEDQAGRHQHAEAGEQRSVDGPPPVAEMRAFRTGHHGLQGPSFTSPDHRTEW
jgi:hypothetical protein